MITDDDDASPLDLGPPLLPGEPLTPARRRLAAAHFKLALWLGRRSPCWRPDRRDEIASASGWAACDAARSFAGEPGQFPAYLKRRVRWTISRTMRRLAPKGLGYRASGAHRRSLAGSDQCVSLSLESESRAVAYIGMTPDPPVGLAAEIMDTAAAVIAALPAGVREFADLSYLHGLTHSEIAARLGVNARTVAYRLDEARARLDGQWEARVERGHQIRAARKAAGFTLPGWAARLGKSTTYMVQVESGQVVPSPATERAIREAIGSAVASTLAG